jgi:NDP-sugar pyrophosphorylase family protein
MKAILICPDQRSEIASLSEHMPLSNLPILGKPLLEYWIEHLVQRNVREVLILATDRPEQVRALVGTGCRWGIEVVVVPEIRELTIAEARRRYADAGNANDPELIAVIDYLPHLPKSPLFNSYADWMAVLEAELPRAAASHRIGVHEIKPGVWIGLRVRISPGAELHAPCWIGEDVFVGNEAVIGPMTILEQGAFVERGAAIAHSVIGPDTFIGEDTELQNSIAFGDTLINWKLNSAVKISDAFLLSSLNPRRSAFSPVGLPSRTAALIALVLTAPFALIFILSAKFHKVRVLRPLLGVRPRVAGPLPVVGDTMIYYELANTRSWFRRWPQLWNIVRGQFAWVGNRPLKPSQAARLTNEFERLWLTSRLGLICLADTESGCDVRNEEARAHASYYAAHANWVLDWKIFLRAVFLFAFGISVSRAREACAHGMQLSHRLKEVLK